MRRSLQRAFAKLDPNPDFRTRSCLQKAQYKSKGHATYTLNKWKEKDKVDEDIRPYHCNFCDKWHLGHRPKYEG